MEDKILVACDCGRRYSLPPEKLGSKLRCKHCGNVFVAEPVGETVADSTDGPAGGEEGASRGVERAGVGTADVSDPAVDPSRLMRHIVDRGFSGTLLVSLVIHLALVGATSIAFIKLCLFYGTADPRAEIRRQEVEKKEKEREAARKEHQQRLLAEHEKRAAEQKEQKAGSEPPGAAPRTSTAAGESGGRKKSPVERRVEETSDERPTDSDVSLDDALDLE